MILPTDIPTRAQLERLLAARDPSSVSIYLPTDPSSRGDAERIELKNLAREASTQLEQAGTAKADVAAIDDEVADLVDDDEFWAVQGAQPRALRHAHHDYDIPASEPPRRRRRGLRPVPSQAAAAGAHLPAHSSVRQPTSPM